ncbi:HET domain-containing protein [Fusarium sp. LHS14.1]|nr:HET domain-containing protein [Fusarium sp. LHS14.1]
MASVYGRTSCNISYVCPPSTDRGQHLRDPRIELPCKLRLTPDTSKNSHGHPELVVQYSLGFIREYWSPTSHKEEWPILSRAWVFQERLLCPRNIYYGHSRLIWECCESFDDELYGQAKRNPESKMQTHALFAASGAGTKDFPGDFETQWTRLVKDYRTESLTYETDRAIAFAGIARAIQGQTKMTYLAGIWKEFAEFQLLWIVRRPEALSAAANRKLAEQQRLTAPSWSWFSIATLPQESRLATDSVGFSICTSMAMESRFVVYRAQILSWRHPHDPEALFHKFEGISLALRTLKVPSKLEWVGNGIRLSSNGNHPFQDCGKLGPKNSMSYSHDDGSIVPGSQLPTNSYMVLTIFTASRSGGKTIKEYQITITQEDDRDENVETQWNYAGLVVVPGAEGSGREERWRRIGAFMYSNSADGKIQIPTPFCIDKSQEEDIFLV